jgi:hypothetical protein
MRCPPTVPGSHRVGSPPVNDHVEQSTVLYPTIAHHRARLVIPLGVSPTQSHSGPASRFGRHPSGPAISSTKLAVEQWRRHGQRRCRARCSLISDPSRTFTRSRSTHQGPCSANKADCRGPRSLTRARRVISGSGPDGVKIAEAATTGGGPNRSRAVSALCVPATPGGPPTADQLATASWSFVLSVSIHICNGGRGPGVQALPLAHGDEVNDRDISCPPRLSAVPAVSRCHRESWRCSRRCARYTCASAWRWADHSPTPTYRCRASMERGYRGAAAQRTAAGLEAITHGKLRHSNVSRTSRKRIRNAS